MRVEVKLPTAMGKGISSAAGAQQMVNMYLEPRKGDGLSKYAIYGTPGRVVFSTVGGSATAPRGQIAASDFHLAVILDRLYTISSAGVAADIGEIEGSLPVDMAFDGLYVTIVAELKSYTYQHVTGTLAEIADGDFVQASSVAALASYTVTSRKDSGVFAWSGILDATTWAALDFATAESEPDNLVAVRRRGNEIALLGKQSTEFWGLTGDFSSPFARVSTAAANIGCLSRASAVIVDNSLIWAGRDGVAGGGSVYRAAGYIPLKIGTPEIDLLIEATSDKTTLRAFSYQQAGHQFYVLTSPGEWTYAWDVGSQIWAARKTGTYTFGADPTGGWDCVSYALNGDNQIVGSADGNLYRLDADTYTDAGGILVREVTCQQLWASGNYDTMDRLEVEIEHGVGLTTGQGSDPQLQAIWSDDGGATWSQPRYASMGVMGDRRPLAYWTRCGRYMNRIIKFRTTDPVKTVFLKAWAEIS